MKETFGEFLHNLRIENQLTLTKMGAILGIDSGALSKIENGKKRIDEKILPLIADHFNIDLTKLKEEYISEQIALKIYKTKCPESVLSLAEEKIKYLKNRNIKQGSINF